jgi:hypothetical protein
MRVVARRSGGRSARATPGAASRRAGRRVAAGRHLVAFDHGGELCFGLRGEGPASCEEPPRGIFDPQVEQSNVHGTQVLYGVTTSAATSVEILGTGVSATGPVSGGGAYAGRFAGQVRFFLVAITAQPYRVLLRDAAGRVVAGADVGPTPVVGRPIEVAHGRLGGERWRAAVYQTTHLWPTPTADAPSG